MSGGMLSVADARARILAGAEPLAAEDVALDDAYGRVLAADLAARRTQPPAAVSAMDGFAVRAQDVASAPVRLRLIGEVAAGHVFTRPVGRGEAVRIFTGGFLPPDADTVVIQELTVREGDEVIISKAAVKGQNVRPAGLDFQAGQVLLARGHRLSARDLALAAAMNHPTVPVHRRPKLATFATGDELVPPGSAPGPGQIIHSNVFALRAQAVNEGAEVADLGIVADELAATVAAIRQARDMGADVLVTTGGASVGEYDLVQRAFKAEGLVLSFWKVAVRPGRPLMHGRLGSMHVLGLPGNPVSAFVCTVLFVIPLLRRLAGRTDLSLPTESAVLGRDLPANDERADYMRATLRTGTDGIAIATPFPVQDSSMLTPLAKADCLVIREPHAPAAKAGSPCTILRLPL